MSDEIKVHVSESSFQTEYKTSAEASEIILDALGPGNIRLVKYRINMFYLGYRGYYKVSEIESAILRVKRNCFYPVDASHTLIIVSETNLQSEYLSNGESMDILKHQLGLTIARFIKHKLTRYIFGDRLYFKRADVESALLPFGKGMEADNNE